MNSRITAAPDFALLGVRMLPGAGDSGCKQNKSQKVQSNSDGGPWRLQRDIHIG